MKKKVKKEEVKKEEVKKEEVKKEEVKKEEVLEVQDVAEDGPQPLQLTRQEILELRALQAEARAVQLELQLRVLQREILLKQIDPEGRVERLQAQIRSATAATSPIQEQQKTLKVFIESRLGIEDLGVYAYDENSGNLTQPDQ